MKEEKFWEFGRFREVKSEVSGIINHWEKVQNCNKNRFLEYLQNQRKNIPQKESSVHDSLTGRSETNTQ